MGVGATGPHSHGANTELRSVPRSLGPTTPKAASQLGGLPGGCPCHSVPESRESSDGGSQWEGPRQGAQGGNWPPGPPEGSLPLPSQLCKGAASRSSWLSPGLCWLHLLSSDPVLLGERAGGRPGFVLPHGFIRLSSGIPPPDHVGRTPSPKLSSLPAKTL